MKRVLIFGNSGAGKSTLAKELAESDALAHLDLDTLAWLPSPTPERRPLVEAKADIDQFIADHDNWVIEGCYADLIALAAPEATEAFFMDLPIGACIANAQVRPWEPHKYESREAQDAQLPMLLEWIAEYENREGPFSRAAHQSLFEGFTRRKTLITSNARAT